MDDQKSTILGSRRTAFGKAFIPLASLMVGMTAYSAWNHHDIRSFWFGLVAAPVFGGIPGAFLALVLTPDRISWGADSFELSGVRKACSVPWSHLELWCTNMNMSVVMKFRGSDTLFIFGPGFSGKDWNRFVDYMAIYHAETRTDRIRRFRPLG